jgi:hypothetical protein
MRFTIEIEGMRRELTPWLPGSQKPQRRGVYQRSYPGGTYSCWDGECWCTDAGTPEEAAALQGQRSAHQEASWRGLSEPEPPVQPPSQFFEKA